MIRGLYTSSAGMQVEALRQEAIANNIANVNTAGFRRDLAIMEARKGLKIAQTNISTSSDPISTTTHKQIGTLGTGVFVNRMVKDFTQGSLRDTQNPYDLGLHGPGFLTVRTDDGKVFYSRDGEFTRSNDGYIVDKAGAKLMGLKGPILANGKLQISTDGLVSIDGKPRDRLATVDFANPDQDLAKHGDTWFEVMGGAGALPATKLEVNQGTLEGANVNTVQEMVTMIACLRQYEANSKAVQAQDETLSRAVNDIAK